MSLIQTAAAARVDARSIRSRLRLPSLLASFPRRRGRECDPQRPGLCETRAPAALARDEMRERSEGDADALDYGVQPPVMKPGVANPAPGQHRQEPRPVAGAAALVDTDRS